MRIFGRPIWTYGPSTPAPTLSSLNYSLVDTQGLGLPIVATGTNLSGATAVDVGTGGTWTSATITATTSTTVSFIAPAKSAFASYDVRVTTPGGQATLASSLEYWTPAQITGVDAYFDSNKGVTASSGAVGTWTDQTSNAVACSQSTGANKPSQVASVFASGTIGALPSIRFAKENWLDAAAGRLVSSGTGTSFFAVAQWTSTDAVTSQPTQNPPLTIVGWNSGSSWGAFGASAGQIEYHMYNNAGTTTDTTDRGSGLNNGSPHLIGITQDVSQNVKAYLGATQQGTTQVFTAVYPSTFLKWGTLGNGYLVSDGFAGDVGAVVVVAALISSGDLTKLNQWAQQRFGAV